MSATVEPGGAPRVYHTPYAHSGATLIEFGCVEVAKGFLDARFTYVASPFNHPLPQAMRDRALAAGEVTSWLVHDVGCHAYSPIAHGCAVDGFIRKSPANHIHLKGSDVERRWAIHGMHFLRRSDAIVIADIDGWRRSSGVAEEVRVAIELGIPVFRLVGCPGGSGDSL